MSDEVRLRLTADGNDVFDEVERLKRANQDATEAGKKGASDQEKAEKKLREEIAARIKAFEAQGRAVNTKSIIAITAYKAEAEAMEQWARATQLTEAEQLRLDAALNKVEKRADRTENKLESAAAAGVQGLARIAEGGESAAAGLDGLLSAGTSIAWTFGVEGPIVAGVAAVGSVIVGLVLKHEQALKKQAEEAKAAVEQVIQAGAVASAAAAAHELEQLRTVRAELEKLQALRNAIAGTGQGAGMLGDLTSQIGDKTDLAAALERSSARLSASAIEKVRTQADQDNLSRLDRRRSDLRAQITQLEGEAKAAAAAGAFAAADRAEATVAALRTQLAAVRQESLDFIRQQGARLGDQASQLVHGIELEDQALALQRQQTAEAQTRATLQAQELANREQVVATVQRLVELGKTISVELDRSVTDPRLLGKPRFTPDSITKAMIEEARRKGQAAETAGLFDLAPDSRFRMKEGTSLTEPQVDAATRLSDVMKEVRLSIIDAADGFAVFATEGNKHLLAVQTQSQVMFAVVQGASRQIIDGLVTGHGASIKALRKAIAEPYVANLEMEAVNDLVLAAGAAARLNFGQAGAFLAAAAKATAGAAIVARLGGISSGGGGGGGGSAGSGGASQAAQLGAQGRAGTEPLRIEVLVVQKDLDGKQLARQRQRAQRLEDRNQPVRVTV